MKAILSLSLLALISACSQLNRMEGIPSYHTMKKEVANFELPGKPEKEEAVIYVARPSNIGHNTGTRYKIYANDIEMGRIGPEEHIFFYLKAGTYKFVSVGEEKANLSIKVEAGENIFIQEDPKPGFPNLKNHLKQVEVVQGKYIVEKTKLGKVIRERPEYIRY